MNDSYQEKYGNFTETPKLSFWDTYKNISRESPFMQLGFLIGVSCLLIAGINELCFQLMYMHASVDSYTQQPINIYQEPIQILPSSKKPFAFYTKNKMECMMTPMADYSISALVVAKNTNVWLRGLMNSNFDNIALIDFGFLCGEVASPEISKHFRFRSKKRLDNARELRPMPTWGSSWSGVSDYLVSKNLSLDYFFTHMSHVHVVPANDNVMSAVMQLKKGDSVKLDGYLVDMNFDGTSTRTSLSRSDTNPTSRGNGACEVMYVYRVQIKNKIYE